METNSQEDEATTAWTVADTKDFTIQGEQKVGTLVAKAAGRVDGVNAREFQDALQSVITECNRTVVLDLARLTYISSAGLRVILLVAKMLQRRDGNLAVCSLSGPVSEVFKISGFDQIIQTYDSQTEAIAALTG